MMAGNGIPLYAVSIQNEPDISIDYGSCRYTAEQIHDFVPYLYSALHSAGAASTRIMIAEQSSWSFDLTSETLDDPRVAPEVGIVAAHGYAGKIRPFSAGPARLWETEASSPSPVYDGSIADGLSWAAKIHDYLSIANVNAWLWWFLTDMPQQGEGTDNSALTDIKGNYPKRDYVTGQWSKFVRPGWSRIGVRYLFGPLRITAFKNPGNRDFAIIAVNSTSRNVSQTFRLNGFSTASVTPWITSEHLSLVAQSAVPVDAGRFTYTLPASSVTTFAGSVIPLSAL
jgi:glucuronoarabinoxylan endo-1,4-beta-xylanase